ncbi:MAG: hypothetical protein ACYCX4_18135, partial [Bacillota bacterium]
GGLIYVQMKQHLWIPSICHQKKDVIIAGKGRKLSIHSGPSTALALLQAVATGRQFSDPRL